MFKNMEDWKKAALVGGIIAVFLAYTHSSAMPLSYDLGGHLSRIYIILNDGLGWTDMWYNGHPLLVFYPPLYHLIFSAVGLISFDLIRPTSFALIGFTAFASMYYYSRRKLSFNRSAASGILFISGWLLYIAHISGSMPQAFAAALAPAFYAEIEESLDGKTPMLAGLLGAAIVLFHHNAAIVVALGAALIVGLNWRKNIFNGLSVGLLTASGAAVWLLPALVAYSDTTYSLLNDINVRGIEEMLLILPLYAAPLLAKAFGSLNAIREHKQQAIIGFLGLLLSLSTIAPVTGSIPILGSMPPYRFYLLATFAASFLVSAADRRILGFVLLTSVVTSGLAVQEFDHSGFKPGQQQAYEYIEGEDVDLLYDSEDTDLRAYAIAIHGKDIADGWSIGSTSLRPGLMSFNEWQRTNNTYAIEFMKRWSVSHAITYQDNQLNRNLHNLLNESEAYQLDQCFEQTCVFEEREPRNAVLNYESGVYVVNASKTLPIPYSSRFNISKQKAYAGFLNITQQGTVTIKYMPGMARPVGALISAMTLVLVVVGWRRGWSLPSAYSKKFRAKLRQNVWNRRKSE